MWSEERTYVQCDRKYGYLGALECFMRRHFQLRIIDSNLIGVLPDYLTKSRGRLLGLFVHLWRQHGHAGLRCTVPGASFILSLHEQHLWKPCGAGHRCDTPMGRIVGRRRTCVPTGETWKQARRHVKLSPRWGKASTGQLLWSVTSTELYHVCI